MDEQIENGDVIMEGTGIDPGVPDSELRGVDAIREALKTIPLSPGVYRMLGAKGDVLYVGKARSLRKRVTSYTRPQQLPERLRLMIANTVAMEVVTTRTEAEALLLEANFIKRMKPRFNILLRDDKTFPWLMLTEDHPFPQITKQRGQPTKGATYWGPFASAWSVNQTLNLIERAFLLRSCSDSVFNNRTRPCLLHQIKRCSAPCVGRISEGDYAGLVTQARQFLSGRNKEMQHELADQMERAAEALEFERAAVIRDRIRGFASLQDSGVVNPASIEDADVLAVREQGGQACIQVFFIRGGRNNGNRPFFPSQVADEAPGEVLAAFLLQFYDDKPPPPLILVNEDIPEAELIEEALAIRRGRRVEILRPQRGEKRAIIDHAALNAREALERRLAESAGQRKLLDGVAALFGLPSAPERIEVYDNSHIMGTNAYGVMIVAGVEGFTKRAYRKFGIRGPITPGDDFAMMREVLTRRFGKGVPEEGGARPEGWPDILLIDGGQGQYSAVRGVLDELGIRDVVLVAIAKGPDRDAGREWFHMQGRPPFQLPPRDPVLYYLQRLRDEAHRFAITTHRAGRAKGMRQSELDDIPGIGPARKRALLNHFGSARGVKEAGVQELSAVSGINLETARAIHGYFHPEAARHESG